MRTMNDAHGAMLRGIRKLSGGDAALSNLLHADRQMPSLVVEGLSSEAWSSVTFAGHRHRLDLKLVSSGEATSLRTRLEARLRDPEIDIRGHVLVDMTLVRAETRIEDGHEICRLSFEALTVED